MNHDIHGQPIKTTQRDDWWQPDSTNGRRRRRRRDDRDTCMVCNCDVFEGYDPLPYCAECHDGHETYGDDRDRRRGGRLGHGDDTSADREGALEDGMRVMEDGQ